MTPDPATMDASAPKESSPPKATIVALLFIRAPPLLTPVPLMLSGMAAIGDWAKRSNAAPDRTVILPLLDLPRAAALPNFRTPLLTVVIKNSLVEPDSVNVPAPIFVSVALAVALPVITPV